MKVIVVGASGLIGAAVTAALAPRHEVLGLSRSTSPAVDLSDGASISGLFAAVCGFDAVVCCAANTPLVAFADLDDEDLPNLVHAKLFGQIALARQAARHLCPPGSITLTGGAFAGPVRGSGPGALVNSGLESFVRAACDELPSGIRLNVVSPGWVTGDGRARDDAGTPAGVVAQAYVDAVEGSMSGRTITAR